MIYLVILLGFLRNCLGDLNCGQIGYREYLEERASTCENYAGTLVVENEMPTTYSMLLTNIHELFVKRSLPEWFNKAAKIYELTLRGEDLQCDVEEFVGLKSEILSLTDLSLEELHFSMEPREIHIIVTQLREIKISGRNLRLLDINANPNLATLDLKDVFALHTLKVSSSPSFKIYEALPNLNSTTEIFIEGDESPELNFKGEKISQIKIIGSLVETLNLPGLQSTPDVFDLDNQNLKKVFLPKLRARQFKLNGKIRNLRDYPRLELSPPENGCFSTKEVEGISFRFLEDCSLFCNTDLGASKDHTECLVLKGAVTFSENTPDLSFDETEIGKELIFDHYRGLISFKKLYELKDSLVVNGDLDVSTTTFPELQQLKSLFISDDTKTQALDFSGLTISDSIVIKNSKLRRIGGITSEALNALEIRDCPKLNKVNFPHLTQVNKITITNTSIENIGAIAPKLVSIKGNFTIRSYKYRSLHFDIDEIQGFINIIDNELLQSISFYVDYDETKVYHNNNPSLEYIQFNNHTYYVKKKTTPRDEYPLQSQSSGSTSEEEIREKESDVNDIKKQDEHPLQPHSSVSSNEEEINEKASKDEKPISDPKEVSSANAKTETAPKASTSSSEKTILIDFLKISILVVPILVALVFIYKLFKD